MATRMGFVPYVMPGFRLAKVAAAVFKRDPKVEGFILDKHGIFTFGESAREAYERMIEAVTLAETRLQKNRKAVFVSAQMPQQVPPHDVIAPFIRGACSVKDGSREGAWQRPILDFRSSDAILNFVNGKDVARYSQEGVVTPDITIRIKNTPLLLPAARCGQDRGIRAGHAGSRIGLHGQLQVLFRPSERPRRRHQNDARSAAARRACAGPRTVRTRAQQEGCGDRRRSRGGRDRMHHRCRGDRPFPLDLRGRHVRRRILVAWSKPSSARPNRCRSRVRSRSITGAGGAIGAATAKAFAAAGAEVALLDIDFRGSAEGRDGHRQDGAGDTLRRHQRLGRRWHSTAGRAGVSAASTSSYRTPARRGRAASAKWTKRRCARASSSISSPTSASRKPR